MRGEKWDKDKGEQVQKDEDETVNQANALWARPKADISEEVAHAYAGKELAFGTDYLIPTILDAPRFTTVLVEDPYSKGPGGGANRSERLSSEASKVGFQSWKSGHLTGFRARAPTAQVSDTASNLARISEMIVVMESTWMRFPPSSVAAQMRALAGSARTSFTSLVPSSASP